MKRRDFVQRASLISGAVLTPSWLSAAGGHGPMPKGKANSCILLWLGGGPAQTDTWDPKRKGDTAKRIAGSAYDAIPTAVRDVEVCEHFQRVADRMDRFTVLRTLQHEVIVEHSAAVDRMHTGRPVSGTIVYPSIGSVVSHEKGAAVEGIPPYVVIGYPAACREPGFLGAKAGYIYLTDTKSGPAGLTPHPGVDAEREARRNQLLAAVRSGGVRGVTPADPLRQYDEVVAESRRLSGGEFRNVFQLESEPAELRERYGGEFGQRCLLARRLVESGTRFVEVSHNLNFQNGTGWDTHNDGQKNQHVLIRELDRALGALVDDLEARGRLDDTLIVVAGEFGRPPEFDGGGGRGHQSSVFSVLLAGGGLSHRGAIGESDELAKQPVTEPITVPDFHATIYATLGIDPSKMLYDGDRPVPITDGGRPVKPLFG